MTVPRTHEVPVEGIGTFTFAHRKMASQLRIEAEEENILGGPSTNAVLRNGAYMLATLSVLTERAPSGWDVDSMDPLDPEERARVRKVYEALRVAEEKFRGRAPAERQALGVGA